MMKVYSDIKLMECEFKSPNHTAKCDSYNTYSVVDEISDGVQKVHMSKIGWDNDK